MNNKKNISSGEIIKNALNRVRRNNSSYSLRALSRSVEVSSSFISAVVNGKKKFPLSRLPKLCSTLGIDTSEQKRLRRTLILEAIASKGLSETDISNEKQSIHIDNRHLGTAKEFSSLDPWYCVAVLDLVTCSNFQNNTSWIAARLGISKQDAEFAISQLKEAGLLIEKEGRLEKFQTDIRFPTTNSLPAIRTYHKKMIEKSVSHMMNNTDKKSFDLRSISSVSMAINPKNLQKARDRIAEVMFEIADTLGSSGECTEVYQLNIQLFPLTKSVEDNKLEVQKVQILPQGQ